MSYDRVRGKRKQVTSTPVNVSRVIVSKTEPCARCRSSVTSWRVEKYANVPCIPNFPRMPQQDWFISIGTPTSAILPTVPRGEMIVVLSGRTLVEELATPSGVIRFSVVITQASVSAGASTTENQGCRRAVFRDRRFRCTSTNDLYGVREWHNRPAPWNFAPIGFLKRIRKKVGECLGRRESRPAALAWTGSKSTNHD